MPLGLIPQIPGEDPHSSPSADAPGACAPPRRFHAAEGVRSAWLCGRGPFGRTPTGRTAAQKAGLRYERKIQNELSKQWGEYFLAAPWIRFFDQRGLRYCQPDGIVYTPECTIIVEVKVNLVSAAWWQLRRLYDPVVRAALKVHSPYLLVVCKYFDPAVPFPEEPLLLDEPPGLVPSGWDCDRIGVLPWKI